MNQETKKSVSLVYWVVVAAASIWNLMGCFIFYLEVFGGEAALKDMTEVQKEWARSLPLWIDVVFGIAVLSGVLGCVALMNRSKVAFSLFMISLVAVLVQMIYSMFIADGFEVMGAEGLIMPGVVVAIATGMTCFSWTGIRKGWLT